LYNEFIVLLLYYISKKGLLEECDKEENVEVTVAAATSCLKRRP
jgi:hypothetical protein